MPSALIIGASRGIGLGLVRTLAGRGWTVTGTVRRQQDGAAVEAAGGTAARADVTDPQSIAALHPSHALDLLLINAGVKVAQDDAAAATTEILGDLFMTNAVGPIQAARALLPHMAPDGMVAFMSSRMGSVALNQTGNIELYRASKAALNSLVRSFAAKLPTPRPVLVLHPGWVRTELGGAGADLDVETSARGMADVIAARRGVAGTAFLDHSGATLPW